MLDLVSVFGAVGIGSIVAAAATDYWQRKKEVLANLQEHKEIRYKAIMLHMYAYLLPGELKNLQKVRPDLKNLGDLKSELKTHLVNCWLYAGDTTILALKRFLITPNDYTFATTILAMRRELWNQKSKLRPSDFSLNRSL